MPFIPGEESPINQSSSESQSDVSEGHQSSFSDELDTARQQGASDDENPDQLTESSPEDSNGISRGRTRRDKTAPKRLTYDLMGEPSYCQEQLQH